MAVTLQTYITQCRRLLYDSTGTFWSDAELTDYINEARLKTVEVTACYRSLAVVTLDTIPFTGTGDGAQTISGVSPTPDWSWTGAIIVGSGVTGLSSSAPTIQSVSGDTLTITGTADAGPLSLTYFRESYPFSELVTQSGEPVMAIYNITATWGNVRYVLNRAPWTIYNLKMRSWSQWQERPTMWAMYGQNTAYIGPVPDQQYVTEWDCVVQPPLLTNPGDVDVLAYPFTECPKYWACYLAHLQQQAEQKAANMAYQFGMVARSAIGGNLQRILPNAYENYV